MKVEAIADGRTCILSAGARKTVRASRDVVDRAVAAGDQVYGVNTGFGHLARVRIPDSRLDDLQCNLIRSHCCGVGAPLPARVVRAILALLNGLPEDLLLAPEFHDAFFHGGHIKLG